VLVSKYADHLPLYRQAQIYARQGVELDRSTLADWTGRAAWWLRPLRDHLLDMLKRSGKLFADETVAPVLDPGRGRTKRGQLWAYAHDNRPWGGSDPPTVAYRYAPDRKACPEPVEGASSLSNISPASAACCRSTAMPHTASSRASATCSSPSAGHMCVVASSSRQRAERRRSQPTFLRASRSSMPLRPTSVVSRPMHAVPSGRNAAGSSSTTVGACLRCGSVRSAARVASRGHPLCTEPLGRPLPLPSRRTRRTGFQHRRAQHPATDAQPQERALRRIR
jgi:hypothetical protein